MTTDQPTSSASTLAFEGEMTIYRAADIFQQLKDCLAKDKPIELDLSGVTEIDSSGLQILLYAQAEAEARGLTLAIAGISEAVEEMFNLLFLKRTFDLRVAKEAEASS